MHFTTFSRSHADMLIFFFLGCQRFVMYERYPYMCLQNRGKIFEVEQKIVGVPPRSSAFLGLAHFL